MANQLSLYELFTDPTWEAHQDQLWDWLQNTDFETFNEYLENKEQENE